MVERYLHCYIEYPSSTVPPSPKTTKPNPNLNSMKIKKKPAPNNEEPNTFIYIAWNPFPLQIIVNGASFRATRFIQMKTSTQIQRSTEKRIEHDYFI